MLDHGETLLINGNYRETQSLNEREVFYFNRKRLCDWEEEERKLTPPKPAGHYEKVEQTVSKYFKVEGESHSGMPGAVVVPEEEVRSQGGILK